MTEQTIFGKMLTGEIPVDPVLENDHVLAFHDIAPQAPIHVVIIPKTTKYANVTELAAADPNLLAEMVTAAKKISTELGDGHYRLVFNNGANAGQTIFHVHAHVLMGNLNEANTAK